MKWICDTHDVQFVRNPTLDRNGPRLRVSVGREREAELAALREYNAILAISESDRGVLERHLPGKQVIRTMPGIEYARVELPAEPSEPPFRYGFIGWNMKANVAAVDYLLDEWWPKIRAAAPDSRLRVAGTVCGRPAVRRRLFATPGADALGFVPSLVSFYRRVDIVLSPVLVCGGLNFKSVEALAAGRLLVANPIGALCLGEGAPAVIAEDGGSPARHLEAFHRDPARMHRLRCQGQAWALDRFAKERTYAGLVNFLAEG